MDFKFEDLRVYQRAIDFAEKVYILTKRFPKDELFGLTSQLRRAAVSISLNIAEGSARTKKDFGRFLDIARGSLFECVSILQISLKQNYIDKVVFDETRKELVVIAKMLSGLKRGIKTTNNEL